MLVICWKDKYFFKKIRFSTKYEIEIEKLFMIFSMKVIKEKLILNEK